MRVAQSDNLDEVEMAIRETVNGIAADEGHEAWSDANWTKELKNALVKLGQRHDFQGFASGSEWAPWGEWLFDLTWADEPAGFLRSLPLIVEMEWRDRGVDDDFQKLVVARAEHRVLLFNFPPGQSRQPVLDRLLGNVTEFAGTCVGDRYLIGGWVDTDDRFQWSLHIVER